MFDTMPDPDPRLLMRAPVQLATVSLAFDDRDDMPKNAGTAWRQELEARGFHGNLLQVRQKTVNVHVPQGTSAGHQDVIQDRKGWQLVLADGRGSVTLFASGVTFECPNYRTYDDFLVETLGILAAAMAVISPETLTSVNLRYANALSDRNATSVDFWNGKVSPLFLGPNCDEHFRPVLTKNLCAYSFAQDADQVELRLAVQPDQIFQGAVAVVFQTEISIQDARPATESGVTNVLDRFHTIAAKLFQAIVLPAYRETLVG